MRFLCAALAVTMLFAAPLDLHAQPPTRVPVIGYFGNTTPQMEASLLAGFRQGLREKGYVEGQHFVLQFRWAAGEMEPMPALAAELVRLKPDVIVVAGTPATMAVKRATSTIPIVIATSGDAVGAGLVASLSRPGGNVTGLSTLYPELEGKRLSILRQAVPKARRIAVLMNPANPFVPLAWKAAREAAAAARVVAEPAEVRTVADFDGVFAAIAKAKPDALVVLADRPFLFSHRARIVAFAAQQRLPAIYPFPEFANLGGLLVFGPDFADMFRRSATYVDKILKGARPADLPVEQPLKFDLLLNMKTAKTLGLAIPPSLMLSADRIIE